METMRALEVRNGAVRFIPAYPRPEPQPDEALIRVRLAGICNTDLEIVRGYAGFTGVPGHEFVGEVVACPARPDLIGRRVVGEINCACFNCPACRANRPTHCERRQVLGIVNHDGAFADYLVLPMVNLHPIPDDLPDELAAFVEPVAAAFEMLEQVHVRPTDRIAVLGDGKLGLLCAQVLALVGGAVTVVGRHEEKLALAARWGLETHMAPSYSSIEASSAHDVHAIGGPWDVVVEASGSAAGLAYAAAMVRPRGTIILKSTVADHSTVAMAPVVVNEQTIVGSRCGPFPPAIRALTRGSVRVHELITARYPLEQGAAAFARAAMPGVLKVQLAIAG